jgi:hypothetical protein
VSPGAVQPPRCAPGRPTPEGGLGRGTYAGELAALYAAYRRRLEALGRPDREGYAWAALDALRRRAPTWSARPVFL